MKAKFQPDPCLPAPWGGSLNSGASLLWNFVTLEKAEKVQIFEDKTYIWEPTEGRMFAATWARKGYTYFAKWFSTN